MRIAISIVLSMFLVLSLSVPVLSECQDPGTEPITQDRLDELLGDPGGPTYTTRECCCYNNTFQFDKLVPTGTEERMCCAVPNEDCRTEWYLTYYEIIPDADPGEWNVDNDHDGDWDESGEFAVITAQGLCFCDDEYQGACFPTPVPLATASIYACEDCE